MLSRLTALLLLLTVVIPGLTLSGTPEQVMTSTAAFTTAISSTSYGVSTMGTNYVTSIQQQPLYLGLFTISAPELKICSMGRHDKVTILIAYMSLPFSGSHGERITVSLSSPTPVSFFVMTGVFFNSWVSAPCSLIGTPDQVLVSQIATNRFSADFTINNPGEYQFVFLNGDRQNTVIVNFSAIPEGNSITSTYTSVAYTQVTQTRVLTFTGSSLLTQTVQASPSGSGLLPVAITATVLALLLLAIMAYSWRNAHQPKPD